MGTLFPPVPFHVFHTETLPERIAAGNGALAARDVNGVAPLALALPDGASFTYVPRPGTVGVLTGHAEAETVVELDAAIWSDFAHELRTAYGLLYAGLVRLRRGSFAAFERWEPALRALYHGRPIYDAERAAALRDREGRPLDLGRSFSPEDPPEDLRHFLHETGFVHVRGVFTREEIDGLLEEADRLGALATPEDGRSWWAKNAAGEEVCCRLLYTSERSARIASLDHDARLLRIVALTGRGLRVAPDRLDGHSVLFKHPDVVEGLSDLPWHRDCGLGGHPVLCPGVNLGIQLEAGSPEAGQLQMLAGSWHCSSHPLHPGDETRFPVVGLRTEPGDVTMHFGHVYHAAPPPSARSGLRRTLYLSYTNPRAFAYIPPGKSYNDVLFTRGDGRIASVDELVRTL